MKKSLLKRKTVWGAIAGLVMAGGAYSTGEINGAAFVASIWACIEIIFIRDALN